MRKFLVSAAIAASTLAIAAPAAAQWAPPPPQGYAYGYQGNYGQTRRLEARVMQLRQQIRQLDRRNMLSNREAQRLDNEARDLQQRVRQLGYNGFDRREAYYVETRIQRLEQRIRYEASDGNRRYGRGGLNPFAGQPGVNSGYGQYGQAYGQYPQAYSGQQAYSDRDRDGRDDRYEDDRGYERDD